MDIRFYKNKYLIAIYDLDDNLVDVRDNAKDFAKQYNRTYDLAQSILSRVSLGKRKTFHHNGKSFKISFIPLSNSDMTKIIQSDMKGKEYYED